MWDFLNRNWVAGYVSTMAICSITLFYLPLHLVLGIALPNLYQPYAVFCVISLPMSKGVYWAQPLLKEGRTRPIYLVMSLYMVAFLVSSVYFGTDFGFFDPDQLARNYFLAALFGFGAPWAGYYLHRKLFPDFQERMKELRDRKKVS